NVERVRIYSSVSSPATLVTGHQYGLMRIQIPSGTLTGCDGCLEGVEIRLVSVQLGTTGCVSAPHAADVLIQTPDYAGSAQWQYPLAGFAVSTGYPRTTGAGVVDLHIVGGGIQTGASVVLRRSGQNDVPGVVQGISTNGHEMFARFNLTGAVLGNWDIVVTNPNLASTTSVLPVQVVAPVAPHLSAQIIGISRQRPSRPITQTVLAQNTGNLRFDGTSFVAIDLPSGI